VGQGPFLFGLLFLQELYASTLYDLPIDGSSNVRSFMIIKIIEADVIIT
jgi:hypothetical protein